MNLEEHMPQALFFTSKRYIIPFCESLWLTSLLISHKVSTMYEAAWWECAVLEDVAVLEHRHWSLIRNSISFLYFFLT